MPELPEVDMARTALKALVVGKRILSVSVLHTDSVGFPDAEEFASALKDQVIADVSRRGKFLFLSLASGDRLTVHFRMTGFLLVAGEEETIAPHTHIIFHLSGASSLRFIDPRRFGRIWLTKRGEADVSGAGALGPEPDDPAISGAYLENAFRGHRSAVKNLLMDQHIVAGIGNIYSDEILFQARVHPARPACELSSEECARIAALIPAVMAFFTAKNKIPPMEYMAGRGREYGNTPYLQVYGRRGKGCPRCGAALSSKVICGRTSVFCPACTPLS